MIIRNLCGIMALILTVGSAVGAPNAKNLSVAQMFSDNMVLQRDMKVPVWGWADSNGVVEIKFNGQTREACVDAAGKWMTTLEPMKAGGPFTMTVSGEKTVEFKNVMLGDVWLCGGQSNIEWPLRNAKNSKQELANANYAQIRLFFCPPATEQVPRQQLPASTGKWQECSPETAGPFSAVGYFFGRDLFKELNIPIGLIKSGLGGTAIELWIPRDDLQKEPDAKPIIDRFDKDCADPKLQENLRAFNEANVKVADYIKQVGSYAAGAWTGMDFDDQSWETFDPSNPAVTGGLFHALIDLRKTVEIPKEWAGRDLVISIYYHMVYGNSQLFFNGHPATRQAGFDLHFKSYLVKGEFVKTGKAVVAEHAFDYQYGKDFQAGRAVSYMTSAGDDKKIMLDGPWKIKVLDKFKAPRAPMHPQNIKALNGLYNAMIHPLMPYAIKGVIWYQGERNASRAYQYRKLLPLMINCWRANWQQGEFPFLIVQLANYGKAAQEPTNSAWAELREAQMLTAEKVTHCGIAAAIDIGEADNIHPTNKQDVGARLSLAARRAAYGQDIVYSGPVYQTMTKDGDKIVLKFKHIGGGLVAKGGQLKHFAIAGQDHKFVWAEAVIAGDTVVVKSDKIKDPAAVRYAWSDNPEGCNLYNKEGLPAFPFRTDDWMELTRAER